MTVLSLDYAQFELKDGQVIAGARMQKKLDAIPFPDFSGKSVLDVGCDHGQFTFYAASKGATVLGLDRNRDVRGQGHTDLISLNRSHKIPNTSFKHVNLGKQWKEYGKFDYVLCMSMYHHFYENCHDHKAVWFWLWRHTKELLIWENPLEKTDTVANKHVTGEYTEKVIMDAANIYFDVIERGPSGHEPHRVYIFLKPKKNVIEPYHITARSGAGGATKAFLHNKERRIDEFEDVIGYRPVAGSLNGLLERPFNWLYHYYPCHISDVVDRTKGIDSEWRPRKARLYPMLYNGAPCHVFRFRGENYAPNFVELISDKRLRDFEGDALTCE